MTDSLYSTPSALYFDDPNHLARARTFGGSRLCGYLMTLAAIQRGLNVTFYGSTGGLGQKIRGQDRKADLPRFFAIEDGTRRHVFDYTCGDLTSRVAADLASDKMGTKTHLESQGIPVPQGGTFRKGETAPILQFLASTKADRFIAKPVMGSHSRGVTPNLDKAAAQAFVKGYKDRKLFVLEEQVIGDEYRVFVVGDKVAGAWLRAGSYVSGDGRHSVGALIALRNARRAANPQMRGQIINIPAAAAYLARSAKSLKTIPVFGQKVWISDSINSRAGGQDIDRFEKLPPHVAETAIAATKAMNLPTAGLDIIDRSGIAYVLEANAKAAIGKHSFPEFGKGSGNTVAESIVDHYFPSETPISRDSRIAPDVEAINRHFAADKSRTVHQVRPVTL